MQRRSRLHGSGSFVRQGAPKGCVTVRAVPLGHLSHLLFAALLEEAEREYGFRHQGAIAIPCQVDRFVQVESVIDRDLGDHHQQHLVDLDNCSATITGGHNRSHIHIHLPRFVGCFRA
ncbi:hypothetical protein ACQ4PT_062427 [Festuca glaucescens]